jgi:hypothetical protein
MSKLDLKGQIYLLKEAKTYFKDVKPVSDKSLEMHKGDVVLTQDHISAWLEVFYDDRIMMNTCNDATVKR